MIQRIQTIWFLLAAVCAFLTLEFSFYSGITIFITGPDQLNPSLEQLNGLYTIPISILTVIIGTLAAVCMFLFKNRKLQLRLGLTGLLLQVVNVVLYFMEIKQFTQGNYALGSVLSFAVLIFYFLAVRGVKKDQKLIKSLDRLR